MTNATDALRVEVRRNEDGTPDEVVGFGEFHLEQMGHNKWWMQLGPHMVWLSARGKITAHIGENEAHTPAGSASGEAHRFDPSVQQIGGGDSEPYMTPSPDGDYVRHTDYAALQAEVAKLREQSDKFMWQVRDTCRRAEKAEAEAASLREAKQWQPIATAPQDTTGVAILARVLCNCGGGAGGRLVMTAARLNGQWVHSMEHEVEFLAWSALPELPDEPEAVH